MGVFWFQTGSCSVTISFLVSFSYYIGELLRVVLLGFTGSRIVFLGRDMAYISSCSRTGGPYGVIWVLYFRVSQIPGVGC